MSDFFIERAGCVSDINKICDEMLEKLKVHKSQFLPFIVAVGDSLRTVTQYCLVLTPTFFYTFTNLEIAVDTAYKIFWVLTLSYPIPSCPVWITLQRTVYGHHSKYDKISVAASLLIGKLERKRAVVPPTL